MVSPRAAVRASVVALALAGAGCGAKPATGLVVVVDADPQLASRLGSIRVRTFAPTGLTPIDEQVFAVGLVRSRFPVSFGVSPREGSTQVRVEVTGLEVGREIVFARAATRYIEGRVLTLPITLWGACADQVACASPVNTCGPTGVCGATTAVDPATLTDYTPGAATPCPSNMVRSMGSCVVPPDASTTDSPAADAVDAPAVDAGTMDAPVDTPSVDTPSVDVPPDAPSVDVPDVPSVDAPDVPTVDAPDVPAVDVPVVPVDVPADVPAVDAGVDVVDAGPTCAAGLTRCATRCVDLATDGEHCGACGRACATGDLCTSGTCGLSVVSLAAGLRHTCAVLHNGNTRCWGGSLTNDLANNDPRMFSTPQFAAAPLGAREVGAGAGLGCVRYSPANRVMCWGDNEVGSVGVNATGAPREATQDVEFFDGTTLTGVTSLALHASHVCALHGTGGNVACWGANGRGQLGDGSATNRAYAVLASTSATVPLANVVGVAVSVTASYALTRAGEVYAWGGNVSRELGIAMSMGTSRPYAAVVPLSVQARRVVAGGSNACIIGTDNRLYCWGANDFGQLGPSAGPQLPREIEVGGTVTDVAVGRNFICAIRSDRSVHCLGANRYGQLGNDPPLDRNTVVAVGTIRNAIAIAAGTDHACALREGNVVSCWGSDRLGQTGSGRVLFRAAPQITPTIDGGVTGLAGLEGGTCARRPDNNVVCWGVNARGELGDGTLFAHGTPRPVLNEAGGNLLGVSQIVGGAASACARIPGGFMACWGANDEGTLGTGSFTDERYPETLTILPDVTSMGLRYATACAVHNSGMLSCWGRNASAQAGSMAAGASVNAPRQVYDSGFSTVAPGLTHTCALRADGKVVCFGSGDRGELGDGTLSRRDAPPTPGSADVQVGSPSGGSSGRLTHPFNSVASGARFSCGITQDRTAVRCWGDNTLAQLGRGPVDTSTHPDALPVEGLPSSLIDVITAGRNHACAVTGQRVYCWGDNAYGATGASAATPTLRATLVAGVARAVTVAAGASHTCAINPDLGTFCWGLDGDGQLGGTVPIYRTMPVDVAGVR